MEFKYFHSTGIDISKLRQQKEWRLILKMLRVYNDIALASGVSFLLKFAPKGPELDPIKGAVNAHLLRHRSAMAAEAMRNVIDPLRNHQDDASHGIWKIIGQDEELTRIWTELSSPKLKEEQEKAKSVRDKLFAHYDQAPINCAFERLLHLIARDEPESAVRWHLQSVGDGGQISRNVLLDELMNMAWYEMYEIEVTNAGPNEEQCTAVGAELMNFLSLVHNFVNGIVIAYLQNNKLTRTDSLPPWHSGPEALEAP